MGSEFGAMMKALREGKGLSLYALARRITWSKAAVGHAETGFRTPSTGLARALDEALDANGVLIALAAATSTERRTFDDVKRRQLLKAIAASTAASGASMRAVTPTGRLGQADVARALERTAQLRRLDDVLGGTDTYSLYLAEVEKTETVLNEGSYRDTIRKALLSLLAEQAQLAGWAAFDAGWTDRSARLYTRSRQAAMAADDHELLANALALDAYQRAFSGQVDVDLADASREALSPAVSPRVRALVHDRAAWSYALAGLAAKSEAALSSAAQALAMAPARPGPDWAAWVDTQEIDIMTGRCWSALGRPIRAVPPLTRALDAFPEEYARDKALYLLALAEAYLHGREVEMAAEVIHRAHVLAAGVASTRPKSRLTKTLLMAARYRGTNALRELRDQVADS